MDRDDTRCECCSRPTVETNDAANPLRRCWQGGEAMYVLCARCEDVARREHEQWKRGAALEGRWTA